jgi:cytochrome c-type biogenesis protein CcmH
MTTLIFWFLAWGLTLGVLGVLLRPLLQRQEPAPHEELEKRLAVYRQQLSELEHDRTHSGLTDEQYHEAKRELERRLLEETNSVRIPEPLRLPSLNRRAVAIALAVVIPALSGLLYWQLGMLVAITHPIAPSPASDRSDATHQTVEGLDALAARLKKKLDQHPDDGVGLALLARSYVELGRHAEAVPLYERAVKLIPNDAQLLADYADALGMLHGRKLDGKPAQLVDQALKLDPTNVKALMLAGTVAFDRKDFAWAVRYWENALAALPPDAEAETRQELRSGIAEAKSLAEGKPIPASATGAPPTSSSTGQADVAITGTVTLAPALVTKTNPGDTLFVFARATQGPPMPVAIVRATKRDLPFTFRLDDATSPMPSRKLSAVSEVIVVARLSKSGEATPQPGDLQGESGPVKPGATGVAVQIDHELP